MKPKTKQTTETEQQPPPVSEQETSEGVTLSELQAENEQLRATIRLGEAHRQITGELAKAGARSPELLFDAVKAELMFTDDGKLENASELVAGITNRFPEQFGYQRAASIDAGAGAATGPQLTKEALSKMKPSEIAELDWADVRRVLSN